VLASSPPAQDVGLLENIFRRSVDRVDCDRLTCGLGDLVDEEADAAVGLVEEKEEKTEPITRFALSREASFVSWVLAREGFLGRGWGGGRRSKGTKPAGSRVMCME
jgi:hypothetical protein